MRISLGVLSSFWMCVSCFAAEAPRYDTERYCRYFAGIGGTFSYRDLELCRTQEAKDRTAVMRIWDEIEPSMQAHCDRFARVGEPANYHGLRVCLVDELKAYIADRERALGKR